MQRSRLAILGCLALGLFARPARADEFYGLQLPGKCEVEIGAITRVTEGEITLFNVAGEVRKIPVADVRAVFIFNSVANPIRRIAPGAPILDQLKAVHTSSGARPAFVGFPVRFIEDLVVFLDLEGKSHVLDLDTIHQIRAARAEDLPPGPIELSGSSYAFDLKSFLPDCGGFGNPKGEYLSSTRTLAEQIRVRQLFDDLEHGYEKLENLQERARFYAKPFLFDRRARLGLTASTEKREANPLLPLYISFSTGRAFRFQGFSVLGAQVPTYLPVQEVAPLLSSEVKAHFFHAYFSGNLYSFSAGHRYFTGSTFFGGDTLSGLAEGEAQFSYNYMALMGFDYGPFSVSGGRFYPIHAFRVVRDTRELLSQDSSPIFEFSYTQEKYKAQLVYSPDVNRDLQAPTQGDVVGTVGKGTTLPGGVASAAFALPTELHLHSSFWRLNGEYQAMDTMRLTASFFSYTMNYKETVQGRVGSFDFSRKGLSLGLRQDFGDYVALALRWSRSWNDFSLNYYTTPFAQTDSYSQLGGNLEFLF